MSLHDRYLNLCKDYSSFIKWGINKIVQNSVSWSDFSISEPDTLLISSISTAHDYTQYVIDEMYRSTDLDLCSPGFLYQISAIMGKPLIGTNPISIPITLSNHTNQIINLQAFEVFQHGSELFTNPESIAILPNSDTSSFLVRNTGNTKVFQTISSNCGEYYINENLEIASIQVFSISTAGAVSQLKQVDSVIDVLGNNVIDNYPKFSLTIIDAHYYRFKIDPKTYKESSMIIIKYAMVDDYPVKIDLELKSLTHPELEIQIKSSVEIQSDRTINSGKLEYLKSLNEIQTINNSTREFIVSELSSKIRESKLSYEISNSDVIPLLDYITADDKPLTGDSFEYCTEASYNGNSGSLEILFKSIPPYSSIILQTDSLITNLPLPNNLKFSGNVYKLSIRITKPTLFKLGFNGIGFLYQFSESTGNSYKMTVLSGELSVLNQHLLNYSLIGNKPARSRRLASAILTLDSEIVVETYKTELLPEIVEILKSYLFKNGNIVNDTIIAYDKLAAILKKQIPEIIDVSFNRSIFIISDTQYLEIKDPSYYSNSVKFKSREGETYSG